MTYGLRTVNNSGIVSIDENSTSYVYLGKVQIDALQGGGDIYVSCVGYPLIFFGIPYNTTNGGENPASDYTGLQYRPAISMTRLRQAPGNANTWIVSISCNFVNGGDPGPLYVRVFGLLHLNFPSGSSEHWGMRLWNAQGKLTFDTGCRQLRLAGNTYEIEMALNSHWPLVGQRCDSTDVAVGLPFDLANKSICANTRGTMQVPYKYNSYQDFETGRTINQYRTMYVDTGYWSTSNVLYARKFSMSVDYFETEADIGVNMTENNIYTRVAVIDNNLYP